MRRFVLQAAVISICVLKSAPASFADEPPSKFHLLARYHRNREGTPPPGNPRYIPHTDERAGDPRALGGHLEPSATSGGIGYYVGGGVPIGHRHREARRCDEGTWGWDETGGARFRRRVILAWSHGRRYQGGTGAYRVDGPVIPDLVYATTSTLNSLRRPAGEGETER
jgi:hypothetical protein